MKLGNNLLHNCNNATEIINTPKQQSLLSLRQTASIRIVDNGTGISVPIAATTLMNIGSSQEKHFNIFWH